jgi:hypothetical protein
MGTNMSLGEENISRGRVGQVRWERIEISQIKDLSAVLSAF